MCWRTFWERLRIMLINRGKRKGVLIIMEDYLTHLSIYKTRFFYILS